MERGRGDRRRWRGWRWFGAVAVALGVTAGAWADDDIPPKGQETFVDALIQQTKAEQGSAADDRVELVPMPSGPPALVGTLHEDALANPSRCAGCEAGLVGMAKGFKDYHPDGGYYCAACGGGCPEGQCIPGRRKHCPGDHDDTFWGRYWCGLCECLCCPDPCYEPEWKPAANAAFWTDHARPQNTFGLRYTGNWGMRLPDRDEFFWARADGNGKGPRTVRGDRQPPFPGERKVNYNELTMVNEAASGGFGLVVETPYRSVSPELAPHSSGFGDITIATKGLLLDCELLQLTFQFKTYIPAGNFAHGLGTGHVSLEPSLLMTWHVHKNTYLEIQLSEWIPIGGDPIYEANVFHFHFSLNKTLCRPLCNLELIGTAEFQGWAFGGGAYTDPLTGAPTKAGDKTYLTGGGGLRLVICDKYDIGVGVAHSFEDPNWYKTQVRAELRVRF